MTEKLENRLIDALKQVDMHGDVAPQHVHDPMTMTLRERALQADLMRWDNYRGRYVLTGTGRHHISLRSRKPATVIRFRRGRPHDAASGSS